MTEPTTQPDWRSFDLFAPTPEHALLADTLDLVPGVAATTALGYAAG